MQGPAPARTAPAPIVSAPVAPGPAVAMAWAPLGVLAGVAAAQTAGGYVGGANGPYIVVLSDELVVPPATLWWIASAFGFALLPVAALGGRLLRFGAGRLLRIAAALGALAAIVLATTPPVPLAAVGAGAFGISGALSLLASTTLLRGAAGRVSLVMACASASGLVAPLAIGTLELAGVSGGWAMLLPLPLLLLVAVRGVADDTGARARPDHPDHPGHLTDSQDRTGADPRAVAAAWLALVTAVVAEFCFLVWGVARLVDAGLPTGLASIVGVAFPLGMVLGRVVGARLPDTGPRQVRARLRLAALVTAVGTIAVVTGPLPLVVAGLLVAGLALATTYPNSLALLVSVPGLDLRRATSLGAAGSGVAIIAAPSGLAALAQVMDLRLAFLLPLPVLALLAAVTVADAGFRRRSPGVRAPGRRAWTPRVHR